MLTSAGTNCVFIVIWFLGRKFKNYVNLFILASYIAVQALQVLRSYAYSVDEPEFNKNPYAMALIFVLYYSLFLSPSIVYLFAYVVIYAAIIGLIYISFQLKETSGPLIPHVLVIICLCIVIFYILQRRELKRFFELEEAVKKEQ